MLRQRAVQLLSALRQSPAGPAAEIAPSLLAHAPQIFKFAQIAVGDADSAAVLTADVLAHAPANEGAALRCLIERLPQGWLSWPSAPGPSEWLKLDLRRPQADRLLSVLGEWKAEERIGLALHLLWDVRRDDLDAWTGTTGMAERVMELVGATGESLRLIEAGGDHKECQEIAADLLEADDPQIGREIRLHTIGCDRCRRRASGLRQTSALLRKALNVFFCAPLPKNLEQLILARRQQQQQQQLIKYGKSALAALVILILWSGLSQRSARTETTTAQAAAPPNATELIDRALNRLTPQPGQLGILHERIRVGNDASATLIERWYDYRSPQRLRVTVHRPQQTAPVFDLATDGTSWVAYEINNRLSAPLSTLVRTPEVAKLMPLLRQLPFVGSFSETPVDQDYMDLTLLSQARHGQPVLLGTTTWHNRPAYVLSSVAAKSGRTILTIDRETLSLLEARIAPDAGGTSQTQRVWEAEVVEILPRNAIRANIFELTTRNTVATQFDPRQLARYPAADLDIDTAVRYSSLPVPEFVPGKPLISHLRGISGLNSAMLQLYESEWTTLAIVTPRIPLRPVPWELLDREFAHGSYMVQPLDLPQATMAWFVMDDAPHQVMQLYFWHALVDEAGREQMIGQILDSLVLVDTTNVDAYRQRFPGEPEAGKAGGLSLFQQPAQSIMAPLPRNQATRRYFRSKLEQTYDRGLRTSSFEQLIR